MVTVRSDTSTVDPLLDRTATKCVVDNCSVAARMILYYHYFREKYGRQIIMSDAYVWSVDDVRCFDVAMKTPRDLYSKERLLGESAAQWQARKQ